MGACTRNNRLNKYICSPVQLSIRKTQKEHGDCGMVEGGLLESRVGLDVIEAGSSYTADAANCGVKQTRRIGLLKIKSRPYHENESARVVIANAIKYSIK